MLKKRPHFAYRASLYCIALILPYLLIASSAYAQQTATADRVNEIAKGLYCPVCESEPLDTCGTQACIDWREEIRMQLEAGRTDEQIYADFVARYGERVLAQPSSRGLNLVLWFSIPLGILAGGYLFFTYLRRISVPEAVSESTSPVRLKPAHPATNRDEYLQRVEEELGE